MNEKILLAERNEIREAYEKLSELFKSKGISSNLWAYLSLLYRHADASLEEKLEGLK